MRSLFSRLRRAANEQFGQSMVELALMLPILVFGLIGAADLARAFAVQLAVQNGARAGAEAYAINFSPTLLMAKNRAKDEISRTPGIDTTGLDLQIDADPPTHTDGSLCVGTPTVANPCFITVTVQYHFRTLIPWPFIPNYADFNRSTTMRTFY